MAALCLFGLEVVFLAEYDLPVCEVDGSSYPLLCWLEPVETEVCVWEEDEGEEIGLKDDDDGDGYG